MNKICIIFNFSSEFLFFWWQNLKNSEKTKLGLIVRAVGDSGSYSLSTHSSFYAYGESESSSDNFMAISLVLGILVVGVAVVTAYRNKLFNN